MTLIVLCLMYKRNGFLSFNSFYEDYCLETNTYIPVK